MNDYLSMCDCKSHTKRLANDSHASLTKLESRRIHVVLLQLQSLRGGGGGQGRQGVRQNRKLGNDKLTIVLGHAPARKSATTLFSSLRCLACRCPHQVARNHFMHYSHGDRVESPLSF
jgi:hypothetical protein